MKKKDRQDIYEFQKRMEEGVNLMSQIARQEPIDVSEVERMTKENPLINQIILDAGNIEAFTERCKQGNVGYENRSENRLLVKLKKRQRRHLNRVITATCGLAAAIIAASFLLFSPSAEILKIENSTQIVENIEHPILRIQKKKSVEQIDLLSSNNIIVTDLMSSIESDTTNAIQYFHLIVPANNIFTVELSDGTKVTLNAKSEIIYPSKFDTDNRTIKMRGEAFFEVTKSSIPFIVRMEGDTYVKVYGTSFNINAYNENSIKTVLIEGSVGVGCEQFGEIKIIPNQMALLNMSKKSCDVVAVNSDEYIGWTQGYFKCIDMPFCEFINELSRWYGINFNYDRKTFNDLEINLSVERSYTFNSLINIIENTIDVKFIKGGAKVYDIERIK